MKRLLAVLLCAAMVMAVFGGCGSGTQTSSAAEESVSSEAAETAETGSGNDAEPADTAEETAEAVPATEDDRVDATDPDNPYNLSEETLAMIELVQEMDAERIAAGLMPGPEKIYDEDGNLLSIRGVPYQYPIDADDVTLEIWAVLNGNLTNWIEGFGDLRAWEHVQEETGIGLTFVSISEETMSDSFNLMVASGDYSDIIMGSSGTTASTPSALLEQEVIINLDDYMEDYMPNYSAWLALDEIYTKETANDEGLHVATYLLNMEDMVEQGLWMRADLLEKYGMDVPVTMDDFEAFFEACKDDGLEQVIGANQDNLLSLQATAYDIPGLVDLALYHIGDTVMSGYEADTAYAYLSKLTEWYSKGYIDDDVISITGAPHDSIFTSSIYSGNMGMFTGGSVQYADYIDAAEVEGFDLIGVADIVMDEDSSTHFMEPLKVKSATAVMISSDCEYPEVACQLLDWFYTDDGINTGNYGAEGLTWYWDSDGNRQFTELIWNDQEFDIVPANIIGIYALYSRFAFVQDPTANLVFQSLTTLDAIEAWGTRKDSEYYLNLNTLSLTDDEQSVVNNYSNDLSTYAEENLLKVVVGDTALTESWWNDFVSQMQGWAWTR